MAPRGDATGEVFRWAYLSWDVEAAKELVPEEVETTLDVKACARHINTPLGVHVDTEYAMSDEVDLGQPVIAGHIPAPEDSEGRPHPGLFPIDGWHRIYRALQEGVDALPCYVLSEEEEAGLRTDHRGVDNVGQFLAWLEEDDDLPGPMHNASVPALVNQLREIAGPPSDLWEAEELLDEVRDAAILLERKLDEYRDQHGG